MKRVSKPPEMRANDLNITSAVHEADRERLRRAWSGEIDAADYEAHMAACGQAQANAALVAALLDRWVPLPARILFAGAGTGQMFDFVPPAGLEGSRLTFSDVNPRFLERLRGRLAAHRFLGGTTVRDDLEESRLPGPFDAAVVVLVLEHIDWRRGVTSLARLGVPRCIVVIQQDPPGRGTARARGRPLPGTMDVLRAVSRPLVPAGALVDAFARLSYRLLERDFREVQDGKQMLGFVFLRQEPCRE